MLITVAMCTRNRADQLARVLDTAAKMIIPDSLEWEFVLIDNGSSDATAEVASNYKNRLPINYFLESKPGLSNARNRAVIESKGTYICWTDDDVVIDQNWLAAYADAFQRYPNTAVFGGPIKPIFEGPLPSWFSENRKSLGDLFAERDISDKFCHLSLQGNLIPYGANYAVRSAEQRRHLYDPYLGVAPQQKRLGEEVSVIRNIITEGQEGIWVPTAKVEHIIPQRRLSLDYVKSYQESAGETWAYLNHEGKPNFMGPTLAQGRPHFLGAPIWLWRMTIWHGLSYGLLRVFRPSTVWMTSLRRFHYYLGAIKFDMRRWKSMRKA